MATEPESSDRAQPSPLSEAELAAETGEALPDREALSTIRGGGLQSLIDNFAMPINEAVAVNNESIASAAIADADQIVIITQGDDDITPDPKY